VADSRSAPAEIKQSDRTDDDSHAHDDPDHLEIMLKQLTSAACDLRRQGKMPSERPNGFSPA
jgi:hypothetical protein